VCPLHELQITCMFGTRRVLGPRGERYVVYNMSMDVFDDSNHLSYVFREERVHQIY
jgi:hypothetical protein